MVLVVFVSLLMHHSALQRDLLACRQTVPQLGLCQHVANDTYLNGLSLHLGKTMRNHFFFCMSAGILFTTHPPCFLLAWLDMDCTNFLNEARSLLCLCFGW